MSRDGVCERRLMTHVKIRSQTSRVTVLLGFKKFVTVLDRPASEHPHGTLDQALPQASQGVVDAWRRLGMDVALDQSAREQTVQGVGQNLVSDAANSGAQLAASVRSQAKRRQYNGIPGMGEEIGGRAQTAIGDQLIAVGVVISHLAVHHRAPVTH